MAGISVINNNLSLFAVLYLMHSSIMHRMYIMRSIAINHFVAWCVSQYVCLLRACILQKGLNESVEVLFGWRFLRAKAQCITLRSQSTNEEGRSVGKKSILHRAHSAIVVVFVVFLLCMYCILCFCVYLPMHW